MEAKYARGTGEGILKDGHTMFTADVIKDLNRKSHLEARNKQLESHYQCVKERLELKTEWHEEDQEIPEDEDIKMVHPLETKDFSTWDEALIMVSAKRSKYALVDLVNYLLVRIKEYEA